MKTPQSSTATQYYAFREKWGDTLKHYTEDMKWLLISCIAPVTVINIILARCSSCFQSW